MEFIRFAGIINTHEEKKVAKATVNVVLEECTGTFYITDIMFQEGKWLTGYVVNNLELLQKNRVDGEITPVRFFNGIVRSGVTAVNTNDGEVSAGLNYHIIPKDTMAAGNSKHQIKVKDRKSALVRMSFQKMAYGIGGKRM